MENPHAKNPAGSLESGQAKGASSMVWEAVFTAGPPPLRMQSRASGQGDGEGGPGAPGVGPSVRAYGLDAGAVRKVLASAADAGMDPDRRKVLEGLALLWHGHWDAAHEIAQSREGTPDYDLLHAILHRMEGDFANAGYWFRSAGKHPCYSGLERALARDAGGGDGEARQALLRAQAEEFRAFSRWLADP